jgi:2-oxoisovalerate dehydrogenase E1 component|tara:strand:+ start:17031 stop:19037 length:2007 start_codon:yes stop_codon:yes gene_type:complete
MAKFQGFQKKQLLDIYRNMILARKLDDREMTLLKQGKAFFHIGCSGHEAAQLAAANNMKPSVDWAYPYYRDAALCLGLGMSGKDQLLAFLAKDADPSSGGRQMPQHYGNKDLRIVTQSSPTGTQFLQAVGCSMSRKWEKSKEIVYVSSGEGSTSEGEFHEALNWSSREKLPVIFHIQDNGYAISVPVSDQIAGSSVFDMVSGYENLAKYDVDGTNFFETNLAFQQAADRARKGKGPSVIVSRVVRLLSHSSSDDQRKYRSEKDLELDMARDPIIKFEKDCLGANVITKKDIKDIQSEVEKYIEEAVSWVENQDDPDPKTALDHIFSDISEPEEPEINSINDKIVMVDAINHALDEEMEVNKKMIVYGEDIADPKGGVFTATKGLTDKYGKERVFNSPLAEASIVGTAIGLAVTGWKPCVEIQFGDYIWPAMMQIRDEAACIRYRSNGAWTSPLVIRVAVGGYIHGGLYHSQSIDSYFFNIPGIRVAFPSNASDAKGLLKSSLRMDDPVIFLEHKGLYRQGYAATPEPDKDYVLPFGKANLIEEGDILTIVTWGAMVQKSIDAIKLCNLEKGDVDLIDLRTLNPIDWAAIHNSVEKTGKLLIVHEDLLTGGVGAEIAAKISDELFEELDGPIKRVAAKDCHVPYHDLLEKEVLPQTEQIVEAVNDLMEY